MAAGDPATPCGLVAKSLFTDSYKEFISTTAGSTAITLNEDNIAWATDREFKFRNVESYQREGVAEPTTGVNAWKDVKWTDMTNGKYFVKLPK